MHLQESGFHTPFGTTRVNSAVNHQGRAEAEHDGDEIRRCEGPAGCLCAQRLSGNFSRIGIADS
jgi:hypothetical protein